MAQYRDIDVPAGIQLRITGDLAIPSNSLTVGTTISEGGTLLSAKYLGIAATAADSSKLGGVVAANYLRADADDVTSGNLTINGTTKAAGAFYAGVTGPSSTNRLNYDGALYATQLYDSAVRVAISTRNISTGSGLTGGGNLTADRTLSVNWGGTGVAVTASRSDHDHDTTYLGITAKAADSELLDGLDSTKFVRNDTTNSIAGLMTITTGGLAVNSGGITSSTTITFGPTATRGRLNYTTGFVMLEATSTNTGLDLKSTGTGVVNINGNLAYHAGNLTISQYVKNDTSGQSVNGNFTVAGDGNLWVGANGGTSGDLLVRNGSTITIQLDGQGDNKQTGVKSYIDGLGNAQFDGNVLVNSLQVNSSTVIPNLNASLINGITEPELVKNASIAELGGKGVVNGMAVTQQTVPNMSVLVAAGVAYTDSGKRFAYNAQSVSLTASSATYGRYDVVYVRGSSGGANEGTIVVLAGTPASTPVEPSIPSDAFKLAVIFVGQNVGSILNANINTSTMRFRRLFYDATGDKTYVESPLMIDDRISSSLSTVFVDKPIKGTAWAKTHTINAGSQSITWTHNLGLGTNYVITFSCNSPNRHVYWQSKATNSIIIWLDDVTDVAVVVDAVITAF